MEVITRTTTQARLLVTDHSFVGVARRTIRSIAEKAGMDGEPLGKLDIISTELATNLAKHACGGGEILVFDASCEKTPAIRLMSVDRGPGICNVENVLLDGYSTTGTMGGGLGSLKRQSDIFELSSSPGKGTVIHCTVSQIPQNKTMTCGHLDFAAIAVPRPGESRCGDGVSAYFSDTLANILVVDALGHGDGAADAADKAMHVFSKNPFEDLVPLAERIHSELVGTRGAAIALVQIDRGSNEAKFVGVGNITCRIYLQCSSKGCVSVPGSAGGRLGSLKEYIYDWGPEARLLIHSDGIKSAAQLVESKGKSAVLAAGEIYRDFCRTTDDTTVVVIKDNRRK